MERRFMLAAMAAFSAVLLVLMCIINLVNYNRITRQQDDTLLMLSSMERTEPPARPEGMPPLPFGEFSPEVRHMLRFFAVYCDAEGDVIDLDAAYIASVSEEEAWEFARKALREGKERGYLSGYRYLIGEEEGQTKLLFLNSERELQGMTSLLLTTASTAAVSLLAAFLLICAFSKKAIAPYVRNIEAQKRFITDAGHELKTPLTAIAASADLLALEGENPWVADIQAQCTRLSRLIADLITLSRLDEEQPFPEKEPFSLSDVAWEIAESFQQLAEAQGKALACEIEDRLTLSGDREAMGRLLSILLDNALRYSDDGSTIDLDLYQSGKHIHLSVSNPCAGAEELDPARLFDRFYRPDRSRAAHTGGNGIGLSIARATAEAHGGRIGADKSAGGIRVWVKL